MKVSFDFDGTLEFDVVKQYASDLIKRGIDVWICTARFEPGYKHSWGGTEWESTDIYDIAKEIGIKESNIVFTNMIEKYKILDDSFIFHLDDDPIEIEIMKENSIINGILLDKDWLNKCESLFKE